MTVPAENPGFPHPHNAILMRSFQDIASFTLPFYAGRKGEIRAHGTGTLLSVGGRYFIVTASHVLDDFKNGIAPFFLPPREDEGPPFPLQPKDAINWPLSAGVAREHDPIDLCIVELTAESAEHLAARRRFAQLSDLGSSRDQQPGLYLMTGYPLENEVYRSEQKLSMTEARNYITELHDEIADPDRGLKFQLWVKYPRDRLITSRGYEPRFPDPNGISGCGVWKLLPKPIDAWTERDRRLVAVEHTHVQNKQLIKATRIELVLQMLATEYPDLIPEIAAGFQGNPSDHDLTP